ncbi:MAG TPA: FISUMP domain-containing protein [Bacteroidales bacterium]|nr:FISUMP domain-containing protein [Bacteroidales bacterium]
MKTNTKFWIIFSIIGIFISVVACNKLDPEIPKDSSNKLLVSTDIVSNVGFYQASVFGSVDIGDLTSVNNYGFVWSREENPDLNNFSGKSTLNYNLNSFSTTIFGLSENTTYYVRAFATSSEKTVYGQQLVFTTVASPRLTTTDASLVTATTAISGGNIQSDGGFAITFRGVCWSTSQNPTITNSHTSDGSGIGSYTSNITGLSQATTYFVRAYATNSLGTNYGNQVSFTTEEMTSFIDARDGTEYSTVQIGNQIWMAENLKYLPYVSPPTNGSTTAKYYYVYNYNGTTVSVAKAQNNYKIYGVLYNWAAAQTACPTGWHLPSDTEWTELTNYLGGESVAGGKLKEIGTEHWSSPNTGATNEFGFSALPGGNRSINGTFLNIENYGFYWSSTLASNNAYRRGMFYASSSVTSSANTKDLGFSVRCVKN